MDPTPDVLRTLDDVLSLGAVVTLITSLEERFGITVDDDEIDGATFGSVGSLVDFVAAKLG